METVTVPFEPDEQDTPGPDVVEVDEIVWEVVDDVVVEDDDVCEVCVVVEEMEVLVYEDVLVVSEIEDMDVVLRE